MTGSRASIRAARAEHLLNFSRFKSRFKLRAYANRSPFDSLPSNRSVPSFVPTPCIEVLRTVASALADSPRKCLKTGNKAQR